MNIQKSLAYPLILAGWLLALVPSLGAAAIQPALEASRTSGVAPLMVFFDATGSSDSGFTGRPFHDLEYRWNFGDAATTWNRGARAGSSSRNAATGPVAAHLYETPGTYTATLSVFNGSGTATRKVTITVADPANAFSGINTICFSTGKRGFSGCPANAQQVKTTDFGTAIGTYKSSGKRLLFRRGETFTSSKMPVIDVDGPGIVGAFGPLADPRPVLRNPANNNALQFSSHKTPRIRDWRVMDLDIEGSGSNQSNGIALVGGFDQLTLLRLSLRKQRVAVMADAFILDHLNKQANTAGHRIWDQLAFVDSEISEVNHGTAFADKGYGSYLSAERLFYAGNQIDNEGTAAADVAHLARFPYVAKAVIANNTLLRPGPTEHAIKLHAPGWGDATTSHDGIGKGYTRWVVIADNKIVGAADAWLVAIGPENGGSDERVRDVIMERNWLVAGPGMQVAVIVWASDVTLRNNIVDSSKGSRWQHGIVTIAKRGKEPPPGQIGVFNESYYTNQSLNAGEFIAVSIEAPEATRIVARNNVAYAPNANRPVMFKNACGNCLAQSNNSTDAQVKSNRPFAANAPATPEQFKAAGYAVGSGSNTAPVWMDFFLTEQKGQKRDMGAVAN